MKDLLFFPSFFFFFVHSNFQEVLLQDLPGLQRSPVACPRKLCNEVSEPVIIPRGSQRPKIPSLPSPSTMKTWNQYFGKAFLAGCQPLPWTLARFDFHSIHVTLFLLKKKNVVGFSEAAALVAKTIEERVKVVLQKPKWENPVRLTLFFSSFEGHILCALMINCTFTLFDYSAVTEPLPEMNPWYFAFMFAMSVSSHINCTFTLSYLMALKEEISAHNSLIHSISWKMPQKQVGLPVVVRKTGIQDVQ